MHKPHKAKLENRPRKLKNEKEYITSRQTTVRTSWW
nr:MAG TPA: hypothetical protein [Caudoviricetes sp.]